MAPEERDHRTVAMRNNQPRLDELEYFLDAITTALFGGASGEPRGWHAYLPETTNLSLLLDVARRRPPRDVAVDLQFLLDDLAGSSAPLPPEVGLFDFRPYLDLRARAPRLLDQLEERYRAPLADLLAADRARVEAGLARVNAYAWLGLVGLPDLRVEFDPMADERPALEVDERLTRAGLDALAGAVPAAVAAALAPVLARVHYLLSLEYRDQLRRLLAPAG